MNATPMNALGELIQTQTRAQLARTWDSDPVAISRLDGTMTEIVVSSAERRTF